MQCLIEITFSVFMIFSWQRFNFILLHEKLLGHLFVSFDLHAYVGDVRLWKQFWCFWFGALFFYFNKIGILNINLFLKTTITILCINRIRYIAHWSQIEFFIYDRIRITIFSNHIITDRDIIIILAQTMIIIVYLTSFIMAFVWNQRRGNVVIVVLARNQRKRIGSKWFLE